MPEISGFEKTVNFHLVFKSLERTALLVWVLDPENKELLFGYKTVFRYIIDYLTVSMCFADRTTSKLILNRTNILSSSRGGLFRARF